MVTVKFILTNQSL